jgi:glutathione peroxidase
MKWLALVCAVAACSSKNGERDEKPAAPPPAPPAEAIERSAPRRAAANVEMGPTAEKFDPAKLPPAGTAPPPVVVGKELESMWNVPIKTLSGNPTTLAAYKGKALMLVNVASQCGNTPQYATLEALQKKYGAKGFTVIGFPCNQFGEQEPGTAEEIRTFCSTNYGITFPIMEKIEVNGPGRHDIYKTLIEIPDAGGRKGDIQWNFEKFVVSADGTKVTRFAHRTKPDDPTVIAAVESALPK